MAVKFPTRTVALSTIDNPFNPFTQFDEWFQFDMEKGYYSSNLLARFAHVSDALSDAEYRQEVERAVDRIVEIEPSGMYKKVVLEEQKN